MNTLNNPYERCLRYTMYCIVLLLVVGCKADKPEDPPVSICCETKTGDAQYMTNVECEEVNGLQVALDVCEQAPPVSLCCEVNGAFSFMTNYDCDDAGGSARDIDDCDEVCCAVENDPNTLMAQGSCEDSGGTSLPVSDCESPEQVCCDTPQGPTWLPVNGCHDGMILPDSDCEETEEVCCETSAGVMFVPVDQCDPAQVLPNENCDPVVEDICCKTDQGNIWIPADQCDPSQVQPAEACPDVCCETSNGAIFVPAGDCPDAQVLPLEICEPVVEDICCKTDQGNIWIPADQCDPSQVQPAEACPDVCCETSNGVIFVPAGDCPAPQILPLENCEPVVEDICCETSAGVMFVPADQCGPAQVLPEENCIEEVCCRKVQGFVWLPSDQCDPSELYPDEFCETSDEVCCETDQGIIWVPANDCPPAQIQHAESCEDVCCETANGVMFVPAGQCGPAQVLPDLNCEPVEEVCCDTATGVMMVPANQCGPAQVLPPIACLPDPPPPCSNFKVLDMASLPATMNNGVTLLSYSGLGPFSGGTPSSNACSTVPAGAQRAFAGVGNDGTIVFDSPVTDFYLLQMHVQTGDDLTVDPTATTAQMGCAPGGFAGNAYHHVVLNAPTTTVNIQDINPGGGSGYSFMVAECMDEAPVEDVCCETSTGVMVVPSDQCAPAQILPMANCEDPEPLGDCVAFQAIDMGNLPYTMNNGVTLQSFTGLGGWGTFPVQNYADTACSTIPPGSQRAAVGIGNDAIVTFDAPVSEFYILTMYANDPGDELVILEPSTLNTQTCDPDGLPLDAYVQVVLDTPSTTATIQDVSPGGGSGYSFMIAECVEWENSPATEPLICCKNPFGAGPDWSTQAECDAAPSSVQPPEVCGLMP